MRQWTRLVYLLLFLFWCDGARAEPASEPLTGTAFSQSEPAPEQGQRQETEKPEQKQTDTRKRPDRVAYIHHALGSISATPQPLRAQTIAFVDRVGYTCRSPVAGLRLRCMLTEAESWCKKQKSRVFRDACPAVFDILMINYLNRRSFLSNGERYALLKKKQAGDKADMNQMLMNRYAGLVTRMVLWQDLSCRDEPGFSCIARKADAFCRDREISPRYTWQACIGAITWFIGNQGIHLKPYEPQRSVTAKPK